MGEHQIGLQASSFLKFRNCSSVVVLLKVQDTKMQARRGQFRRKFDRLLELFLSISILLLLYENSAQIIVSRGVLGLHLNRGSKLRNRLIVRAHSTQSV